VPDGVASFSQISSIRFLCPFVFFEMICFWYFPCSLFANAMTHTRAHHTIYCLMHSHTQKEMEAERRLWEEALDKERARAKEELARVTEECEKNMAGVMALAQEEVEKGRADTKGVVEQCMAQIARSKEGEMERLQAALVTRLQAALLSQEKQERSQSRRS